MSNLTISEKRKLEIILRMRGGYVLNFSNHSMAELFFDSVQIDIYDEKYNNKSSGSKANRLRSFWEQEPSHIVGKLLLDIFKNWPSVNSFGNPFGSPDAPPDELAQIANRLMDTASVPEINAIKPITDEKDFEGIAKSVRESIERNEPENGLDRLHTYLVKYFRTRIGNYGGNIKKNKPLHSLAGEYIKIIKQAGLIESEMTERILKSNISIMEAFNDIRNNRSYAHDNSILNYDESILIFGHVTNTIRFIEQIEAKEQLPEPPEPFEVFHNAPPF